MPNTFSLTPLASAEAEQLFSRGRGMDLQPYIDELRKLQPGQAAELRVPKTEERKTKRALNRAAKSLDLKLQWVLDGERAVFMVVKQTGESDADADVEAPQTNGTTAAMHRVRRGRRNAETAEAETPAGEPAEAFAA